MRESLPSEPEPADDVAAVRFQLPQGVKLARRFHRNHSVQVRERCRETERVRERGGGVGGREGELKRGEVDGGKDRESMRV